MFDRPGKGQGDGAPEKERALLIQVDFGREAVGESLEELQLLATSAGAEVAETLIVRRSAPDPAT